MKDISNESFLISLEEWIDRLESNLDFLSPENIKLLERLKKSTELLKGRPVTSIKVESGHSVQD